MTTADRDELPFSLDWLAGTLGRRPEISVCELGHLKVRDNTCWQPARLQGQALVCRLVEPHRAEP